MTRHRKSLTLCCATLALLCVGTIRAQRSSPQGEVLERPNWEEGSLQVGADTRWYRLYVPNSLPEKSPLVLLLHGGRQSMRVIFTDRAGGPREWANLADKDRFLLLVPNGTSQATGDTNGDSQGWNDGRLVEVPLHHEADDVTFISTLLDLIARKHSVDPGRIYVTGASNGGMMTYRLLVDLPDRFAAGAAFIANLPSNDSVFHVPASPTPLMIADGTKDGVVKWGGGEILQGHGFVESAEATVSWWVKANKAREAEATSEYLPDFDPEDGCRVKRTEYPAGEGGEPVVFYTLEGAAHSMPSRNLSRNGVRCRDIEGAEVAWDFLKKFRRGPGVSDH